MTTTLELVQYYANLLIFQYQNKPKAYNTIITNVTPIVMAQQSVQTINFSPTPTSGTFKLSYNNVETSAINWNDSVATIQTKLRTISDLSSVTISGSISSGLTINFVGLINVAQLLVSLESSLTDGIILINIAIKETDLTLPLAVQDAFNIDTAIGVQLDILGKYTGVVRTINTSTQTIILNDDDFRTLIKFSVVQNNSDSSLSIIENNLNIFFPNQFIITDYKLMFMSYIFSTSLGSIDLFLALINEKLVPKPMAVGLIIIVIPTVGNLFGYSSYETGGLNPSVKPYNTYQTFDNTWLYLQYENIIS